MFTDEELYEELKNLPDFKNFPLPTHWYSKFNIPKPEPVSFQTYAMERRWMEHKFDTNVVYEVRNEPVPGGVRPLIEPEEIPMEVISGTSCEMLQQTTEELVPPTESNDSKPQQSSVDPSVPSCDAD